MAERILSEETINTFREYLVLEEKSTATVEKYLRDVRAFHLFACQQAVTKERMMAYKKYLIEKGYGIEQRDHQIGRYSGTQQHRHNKNLYYDHRHRTPAKNRTIGPCSLGNKKRHIISIMLFTSPD